MPTLTPAPEADSTTRIADKTTPQSQPIKKIQTLKKLPPLPRLHKHADYQRVYRTGKRYSLPLMTYFFVSRAELPPDAAAPKKSLSPVDSGPRVGLTTGRVLGKAVDRNRIKRRMREAVRRNVHLLSGPVDVILHPRRAVLDADFGNVEREVGRAFQAVQHALSRSKISLSNLSLSKLDARSSNTPAAASPRGPLQVGQDAASNKK